MPHLDKFNNLDGPGLIPGDVRSPAGVSVTPLKPPPGFGLASPPDLGLAPQPVPASAPVAAPELPASPPAASPGGGEGGQRDPGIPQFADNPLGAIGFLLQQFGAGIQGKETPLQRLRKEGLAERRLDQEDTALRLQAIGTGFKGLNIGIGLLENTPPAQSEEIIERFANVTVGFDLEGTLRAFANGQLANFKENLAIIENDLSLQALIGFMPNVETATPAQLNEAMQKAVDAKADIAKTLATEEAKFTGKVEAVSKLTGQDKKVVAERLAFGKEDTDSFFRALDELERLSGEGKTPANNKRAAALQKRLDSLTEGKGFAIKFNPNGTIEAIVQGGDSKGLFSSLSGKQQLESAERADALVRAIGTFDEVIAKIDEDPTAFGALGSVRKAVQTMTGIAGDLGELIEGVSGVDINKGVSAATRFLADNNLEGEFEGFFDPQLSKTKLLENTLAFELARLRLIGSGGDMRALRQAFLDARDDVNLTGLTASRDVRARLVDIRGQFARELSDLSRRLSGQEVKAPSPSEESDEAIKRRVDEILGSK